jgi:Mor family transcriptional regulator
VAGPFEIFEETRAAIFETLGDEGQDLADYVEGRLRERLGGDVYYVPLPTLRERNAAVLRDYERTRDKAGVCRRHGISISTFYRIIRGEYIQQNLP